MSQFLTYLPQFEGILPKWLVFVRIAQSIRQSQQPPAKPPGLTLPATGLRCLRP